MLESGGISSLQFTLSRTRCLGDGGGCHYWGQVHDSPSLAPVCSLLPPLPHASFPIPLSLHMPVSPHILFSASFSSSFSSSLFSILVFFLRFLLFFIQILSFPLIQYCSFTHTFSLALSPSTIIYNILLSSSSFYLSFLSLTLILSSSGFSSSLLTSLAFLSSHSFSIFHLAS